MKSGSNGGGSAELDFFVSYVEADRPWAEWIAWHLGEAGYRVLKAWDRLPGSNRAVGVHDGVRYAARTIVVLSDDYLRFIDGKSEWQALVAEPDGLAQRLLVARVAEVPGPGPLGEVINIDLFGRQEPETRSDLLRTAEVTISGAQA